MKKNILYFVLLVSIAFAGTSCTKNINLNLNNDIGRLVIEGNLTNVSGPQYVKLSRNVAFSATNTYPPVTGALVTISDSLGDNYTLTEGPAGTYVVNNMAGISGITYTMNVVTGGQTYTARSTMPGLVPLDSIGIQNEPGRDHRRQAVVYFHDPAGVANQYRFVEYINGAEVPDFFAFNDQFNNGKDVGDVLRQIDVDINPGDTVTVEMQCIDPTMFTYWFTLEQEGGDNLGQQTAAPSNPPNNITPVALGYFSAHTTQRKSIVAP